MKFEIEIFKILFQISRSGVELQKIWREYQTKSKISEKDMLKICNWSIPIKYQKYKSNVETSKQNQSPDLPYYIINTI